MKFCTKCGNQLNDNAAFCSKCGSPQEKFNNNQNQSQEYTNRAPATQIITPHQQQKYSNYTSNSQSGKDNKTIILYAVIAILAVLLIGGGVWFFLDKMYRGEKESQVYVSSQSSNQNDESTLSTNDTHIKTNKTDSQIDEYEPVKEEKPKFNFNGINYLKGKIDGKYAVNMELDLRNWSGRYCYDKYGPKNSMDLVIIDKEGDYLVIEEYNKHGEYCGEWRGSVTNGVFKGTGTFLDKNMPFKLSICTHAQSLY